MRVLGKRRFRVRQPYAVQHLDRPTLALCLREGLVLLNGLQQLAANGVDWVERRARFLKNHRDLAPADRLHLGAFRIQMDEVDGLYASALRVATVIENFA